VNAGYILEVSMLVAINTIVALGLYIQMSTGQLSACQAAFMGIGGYASALLSVRLGLGFPFALAAGALVSAIIAGLFSALVLRLSHWFLAVATLAFGEALVVILLNVEPLGGALGFHGIPLRTTPLWVFGALVLTVYVLIRLEGSHFGYAFHAINHDDLAARALGVDVRRTRILAFALGGMFAGLGGGLLAHLNGLVQPTDLGFAQSLPFLLFVAIGGTRTFWGTLLGSVVLGFLPELLRFSTYDRYLLYGVLIIVVMILRPQGLLSQPPRWPWLAPRRDAIALAHASPGEK
jgi:branched-chain amino acid transport system permease protein